MNYTILYDNPEETLLERLLKIRNVTDHHNDFLDPKYKKYWQPFTNFTNHQACLERMHTAIERNEKIMIFGDYDVDGIMASYVLYTFFRKYIGYDNVSVRLPHRVKDGYGIKSYHIDQIKEQGCDLIITVDNGITSVSEMNHAKEIGIDCIITDHHMPLDTLPVCDAVINPQCGDGLRFKEMCGATVALKVALGYADHFGLDSAGKKQMLHEFLPFVAIATVADCMPLVDENRLLVKKGLSIINNERSTLPPGLRMFLDHLNIKKMDTYHIGFMIGPRLNATGRMGDALDGLKSFLFKDEKKITDQFAKMEQLNTDRRALQDKMMTIVKEQVNPDDGVIIVADESFHEGIVGIVAGRVTEKYNKPSLIVSINHEKGTATGSLRGPHYFSIVDMLKSADHLLERYGGHEQAGGMTVTLENMEAAFEQFKAYSAAIVPENPPEKQLLIDTYIYGHELQASQLKDLAKLGPFGEGNNEPLLFIEQATITRTEQIGKNGGGHLKIYATKEEQAFTVMQRGKGDQIDTIIIGQDVSIIGKIKEDTYNGGFYIDGKKILPVS